MLTKKSPKELKNEIANSAKSKKEESALFSETGGHEVPRHDNQEQNPKAATAKKTTITIKYDVGFHNFLTIRGEGANLSWKQGQLLINKKSDEWVWETTQPFNRLEFKILINDRQFEKGANHSIKAGETIHYTPHF